jgi:hypothetical protein
MSLFDINGNTIETGSNVSSTDIKTALIGAVADGSVNLGSSIGATLAYTSPSAAWETNAETAYKLLLDAYKQSPNSAIPFFITTDQHGRGVETNRWLNNRDKDGMNILNINLGDTVTDKFNLTELNNILARAKQIKNYVSVVGNHECLYGNEIMSSYELCITFVSTNLVKHVNPSPSNSYAIIDDLHNVKYIILEEYIINADGKGFERGLTAETTDWLIRELSEDDGYDVVLLKHWFLKLPNGGLYKDRAGTQDTASASGYLEELTTLFINRKNKTAGSYTDIDGTSHSYDFTNCKTELLCALHGHEHKEVYGYADKLLCYCADWLGDNMNCTFGLIDRESNKLRVWIFGKASVLEEFAIDLN